MKMMATLIIQSLLACKAGTNNPHFHLWLGCGVSTNTKSKLLAFWCILQFAWIIGIPSFHIFGDSQIIINWHLGLSKLEALDISHQLSRTEERASQFIQLQAQHIYRVYNEHADLLSKKSLHSNEGTLLSLGFQWDDLIFIFLLVLFRVPCMATAADFLFFFVLVGYIFISG